MQCMYKYTNAASAKLTVNYIRDSEIDGRESNDSRPTFTNHARQGAFPAGRELVR
jgi:hypothetical protein